MSSLKNILVIHYHNIQIIAMILTSVHGELERALGVLRFGGAGERTTSWLTVFTDQPLT